MAACRDKQDTPLDAWRYRDHRQEPEAHSLSTALDELSPWAKRHPALGLEFLICKIIIAFLSLRILENAKWNNGKRLVHGAQ